MFCLLFCVVLFFVLWLCVWYNHVLYVIILWQQKAVVICCSLNEYLFCCLKINIKKIVKKKEKKKNSHCECYIVHVLGLILVTMIVSAYTLKHRKKSLIIDMKIPELSFTFNKLTIHKVTVNWLTTLLWQKSIWHTD